jgi:hypothetical protein
MLLQRAHIWELHDYLIQRNFVLYAEANHSENQASETQWQHEPSGSVICVPAQLGLKQALHIAYLAHSANRKFPSTD